LLSPQASRGQVIPLQDIAPIAELEIATDDLIRVATSYADVLREFKTAQLSVKTLQTLHPNANITDLEIQIALINLKTAESKVRIIRAIAEKLLAMAQAKLDFLKRMEQGDVTPPNGVAPGQVHPRLAQAQLTVDILQMILALE
ncbi:MAG: hypothetical protein JW829_09580, partial [Pirellulales bacterium]|nr:hypothetical protein [Pirellulales bacterium]